MIHVGQDELIDTTSLTLVQHQQARSMCQPEALSLSESLLCTVPSDSVLMPGDASSTVPKEKFCLNSCVPQQDPESLKLRLDSLCVDITQDQMSLITADENGVDPACIIAHLEKLDPDYVRTSFLSPRKPRSRLCAYLYYFFLRSRKIFRIRVSVRWNRIKDE